MVNGILIEACVDSVEAAEAAIAAGADRLEVCSFREPGGVTPSFGLVEDLLVLSPVPLHVLVRPRGGRFVYLAGNEMGIIERQVQALARIGAHGVVTGALTEDRDIDQPFVALLREYARPLAVTFHRAFDVSRDRADSLEVLVKIGVHRVLTSGHPMSAEDGIPGLRALVRQAERRIGVIAAGGIRGHNVLRIVQETGVREVHSRGAIGPIVQALKAG